MKLDDWLAEHPGGLTRLQLASKLSYTAVHNVIRGRCLPRWTTAKRLSAATDGAVPVDEFFARADHYEERKSRRESKPGWRIVAELEPRDGDDYARCECSRGHLQDVPIDVVPPPPCNECIGYTRSKPTAKRSASAKR